MSTVTRKILIDETFGEHRLTGELTLKLMGTSMLTEPITPIAPAPIEPIDVIDWQHKVAPGSSIQSVIDAAQDDDTILIPDGIYYDDLTIRKKGLRLIAENPGRAILSGLWREAYEGKVDWKHEDNNIYSAPHGSKPYIGSFDGVMLFPFSSKGHLEAKQVWTSDGMVKTVGYGYAHENGRCYVRLPNGTNPNGKEIKLCSTTAKPLIKLVNAPGVTIDGLAVVGAGNTDAIGSDRASHHLTLRNIVSTHNRRLAAVSDNTLVEWCDYSYEGMYRFVDDLIDVNGEAASAIFKLVKRYYAASGNAFLEGGICEQAGSKSSKNCEFRFNNIHHCFDGMRMGAFHESKAHHNFFNYCYDDAIELEHWRKSSPTSKNEVYENLILNSRGSAFSHQDSSGGGMKGPHYVYRNVVWITDRKHSHPPYIIKNRKLLQSTKIFYWNNILMNERGENHGWGWTNWIWWRDDGKNDQRPENITMRNNILVMPGGMTRCGTAPNADGNVLINDVDNAEVRGPNGIYVSNNIDDLKFADPDKLDFTLLADSPARNRGRALEAWWPKNDTFAGRDDDAGVFPFGETMPDQWPRPRELTFSRKAA